MQELHGKHIVIIIEGFPVPLFKIVMQHARTLRQHGADVSIISPKMFGLNNSFEVLEDIAIYRHPMPLEADDALFFFSGIQFCTYMAAFITH
jgi:hypothetical protein